MTQAAIPPPAPPTQERPTTIRLTPSNVSALDQIGQDTGITRNALIGLAITAMLDFVARTGKLPAPNLKKGKRGGGDAR